MRILVTGAAGRIGSQVASHLHEHGHDIVGVDAAYRPELPFALHVIDLCDYRSIYNVIPGCEAVIHLANHPHARALRPSQKVLSENTAMNINVFTAALDTGVRNIVSISSIQATTAMPGSRIWHGELTPCVFPYLPIDGQLPRNPGHNVYALSKVFGEQTLEVMAEDVDGLAAVSVRLPWVNIPRGPRDFNAHPLQPGDRRLREALAYVEVGDVCTALRAIVERPRPGYRQYLVAQSFAVRGMSHAQVATEFLSHIPVQGPLDGEGGLVDLSALKADFDWSPAEPPIELELAAQPDAVRS